MADTVLTELIMHEFDSVEQMNQHESDIGENDLVFTDDTSIRLPILTSMFFDHQANDESWLNADTFSWQPADKYKLVYEHLVADIDGKTTEEEIVGDITVLFYRADDGHKICLPDQESNLVALYEATGVAWYYILDTVNKQFKLPRTKYGFTGLRDSVGGYVAPGLPNITGQFTARSNDNADNGVDSVSGVFRKSTTTAYSSASGSVSGRGQIIDLDASIGSSIYGNGDTVQQPATQMYLYFYVGNFEQDAVEQTAGLNAELFNGKVDVDLNNINPSNSAKAMIVGWGMPDYSAAVSMSSGSSAPKNGWAIAHGLNADVTYSVNGVSVAQGSWNSGKWSGNWNLQIMVSAGDVVTGGSWKFIPCKGVN